MQIQQLLLLADVSFSTIYVLCKAWYELYDLKIYIITCKIGNFRIECKSPVKRPVITIVISLLLNPEPCYLSITNMSTYLTSVKWLTYFLLLPLTHKKISLNLLKNKIFLCFKGIPSLLVLCHMFIHLTSWLTTKSHKG